MFRYLFRPRFLVRDYSAANIYGRHPVIKRRTVGFLLRVTASHQSLNKRCYAKAADKPAEHFEFQAETKNLLDIVAKSLYSDQEVSVFD